MRRVLLVAVAVLTLLIIAAVVRVAASVFMVQAPPGWVADGTDVHGDPLPEGAVARLGTVRFRSTTWTNLCWLSDGRIASGGFDHEIVIWDGQTGERVQVLRGHREELVLPARKWRLWDLRNAVARGRPATEDDALSSMRLTGDGERLVSAGHTVREWDLATGAGRLVAVPDGRVPRFELIEDDTALRFHRSRTRHRIDLATGQHDVRVVIPNADELGYQVAHSEGHALRVYAQDDRSLLLADLARGTTQVLAGPHDGVIPRTACFGPDGARLWCIWSRRGRPEEIAQRHSRLTAIDIASGVETASVDLLDDSGEWWGAACAPDGRLIAIYTRAGRVELRDPSSLALVRVVDVGPAGVSAMEFTPDSGRLALRVGGTAVVMCDVATGERLAPAVAHEASVFAAVFLDDERVMTAAEDGTHRAWDVNTGRLLWTRSGTRVEVPATSPVGGLLAVSIETGGLTVRTSDGVVVASQDAPEGWQVLGTAPDGTLLLESKTAFAMLGPQDDAPRQVVDRGIGPMEMEGTRTDLIAWDHEGDRLLLEDNTSTITSQRTDARGVTNTTAQGVPVQRLMDLSDGGTVWTYDHRWYVSLAAFHGDLAALASGHRVRVLDSSGEVLHRLQRPHRDVSAIAFSRDGRRLATGGTDGVVRIWSVATGTNQRDFRGHGGAIRSLTWSPDGTLLVSTSTDTTALVWDVGE